jgi:methionyl-tRNA formyltransferase
MTRLVFLGSPEAAVPTLELIATRFEVGLVVTQPDRPRGRSGTPQPGPVKQAALDLGLKVLQPETHDELQGALEGSGLFHVGVVVAYGRILRSESLAIPAAGMLNVHFSLLPRWRGAAPVNRALVEGDTMTGVTIIRLDEGLDTGPVLTAQAIDIEAGENAGHLTERLARLGARLLVENLEPYLRGELVPVTQTGEGATYASKLTRSDRTLSLEMSPAEFVNRVRGLAPSPGAILEVDGQDHKILAAEIDDTDVSPGTWKEGGGWPVVGLSKGSVRLASVQSPGRGRVEGDAWLRGRQGRSGRVG